MKKIGILLSMMVVAMLFNSVQAMAQTFDSQMLVGAWVSEVQKARVPFTGKIEYQDTEVYNDDNSYESITVLQVSKNMFGPMLRTNVTIQCTGKAKGTWTLDGNKISYQYDKSQTTFTVDDVIITAKGQVVTDPEIVNPVKEEFEKELTSDLISYVESVKIKSLDANQMVQKDGSSTTTYKRKLPKDESKTTDKSSIFE